MIESPMASHKPAPHPYQKQLWKAGYAWLSFQSVVDVCDYILNQKIKPESTIYYPLVTAISVFMRDHSNTVKGSEA